MCVRSGACPAQLSTQRQTSSIPVADDASLPLHQQERTENWIYPSEQQFYDAMQRKVLQMAARNLYDM